MLFGLLEVLTIIYAWTWFIWPFLFVFSLAHGIREVIADENAGNGNLALAAVSLNVMLAGIFWPLMQ